MFMVDIEKPEEKRKATRVKFQEALDFHWKNTPLMGGCLACDLSEGGIRINFNEFVPLDTEIELTIKLKDQATVITLLGKVVWVKQVPFSDRYQIGLEFAGNDLDSATESSQEIHQYINSLRN
jgi:Tfp pilus assembly protein PilZ